MKKNRIVAVIALVCILCMAVFTGCGAKASDEELIIANIEEVLGLKVSAEEIAEGFREDEEFMDIMDAAKIDVDAYAKSIADHFSAEVSSVVVDGTNATATVTVNAPDFASMSDLMDKKLEESMDAMEPEKLLSMTEEEIMEMVGEMMVSICEDPECPMTTSDVEVPYVKNAGKWEMVDQAATEAALAELMSVE